MNNKKGAEMTIGTIIVIILALVVLVVLIYGFSTGWSNLWQNIIGYGGGKVNVQTVVQSCQVACATSSTYDYCTKSRDVVFNASGSPQGLTCKQLEYYNVGLTCGSVDCGTIGKSCMTWGGKTQAAGTCDSASYELHFQSLDPLVCCVAKKNCNGTASWNGRWVAPPEACTDSELWDGYQPLVLDTAKYSGKICCIPK